jgi:hypothetical protein
VFAFVADPCNDPAWCPKVRSVTLDEGGEPAPGARYTVVHRPIPIAPSRRMSYVLTSWDPPREIRWHEDDGHDQIVVTYLLRELSPTATQLTQRDELQLGAPRALHPLIRRGIRRDVGHQLRRLRRYLESTPG